MAEYKYDRNLSKKLAYFLRHGAKTAGLKIKPNGFIAVDELLQKLNGYTLIDIEQVVQYNEKNRYTLCINDDVLEIKANQGHSIIEVKELSLKPVYKVNFDVIHGTYFDKWKIISTEGLSRMNRNHIHFSKGVNFICGLRKSAEVFIYINFEKAIQDNIKFYESENGVILSSGDFTGCIGKKYFQKVISKSGKVFFCS